MFDWILEIIGSAGLIGLALLMFLENIIPPIPSELIMPLAGFEAARGRFNLFAVVAAGTVGSMAGAVFWYEIGRRIGHDRLRDWTARHGRWVALCPADVDRSAAWFDRHGPWAVFLARLLPGARTLISVPAGVARMSWAVFLAATLAGTVLWCFVLVGAGYVLQSQYQRVEAFTDPITYAVIAAIAGLYLYRVATWGRRTGKKA